MFAVMAFVFPHDTRDGWSPAVLGMVQHLSMGSGERIPCFLCLCGFCFPCYTALSQPMGFLTFISVISCPIPPG